MRYKFKLPVLLVAIAAGSLAAQPKIETELAPQNMSVEKMRGSVEKLTEDVTSIVRHVNVLRASARKGQDIIKLTCINDVLVQLKAQQNFFELNRLSVEQSLSSGISAQAQYEATTTNASAISKLGQDADACAGETELSNKSRNFTDSPEIIDDPTHDDDNGDEGIEPPAYASPYR